jgi:hypothetical protein
MPHLPGPQYRGVRVCHRHGNKVHQADGWHSVIRTPTQAPARGQDTGINSFRLFDFFRVIDVQSCPRAEQFGAAFLIPVFRQPGSGKLVVAATDACIAILIVRS